MAYDWLIVKQKARQDETEFRYVLGHDVTLDLNWRVQVEPAGAPFRVHTVREVNGQHACTIIYVWYDTAFDINVALILEEDWFVFLLHLFGLFAYQTLLVYVYKNSNGLGLMV